MAAKTKTYTKRELEKLVNILKRKDVRGSRRAGAKIAGMTESTYRRAIEMAEERGIKNIPAPMSPSDVVKKTDITDEELREFWAAYERYAYDAPALAEAYGVDIGIVKTRIKAAQHRLGATKKHLGATHANAAKKIELPKKGRIKRYILTCAQNNTALHEETWASLLKLSAYYDAEIKVSRFTYCGRDDGSEKPDTEKKESMGFKIKDRWYDPRLAAFISDDFEQLAPGLVWCGHFNTLPTSSDPLRGKDSLNGRASGIFPHTRIEMRPIATAAGEATKFNWTTGAVTLRNYIQKNAGITAEFYHCFGGLLVEVDDQGNWWVRQLNADSEGVIYDIDIFADPDGVWQMDGNIPALVFGDIHEDSLDPDVKEATWGEGGLVDRMRPSLQVIHDLLNMNNSHHNRRDPHIMYMLMKRNKDLVWDEIKSSGKFLDEIHRVYDDGSESEELVVDSNHHRHFDRFLKEVDWRQDLRNARTILRINDAWLDAIDNRTEDDFLAYEFALRQMGFGKHAFFMNLTSRDEAKLTRVVCPANGGGVEIGAHHGHLGPNGAHGTPRNLNKLGRKNVIADKHAPGIWGGTYVAGMSGDLRQLYNLGPGGWAPAHVPVYPNGKRQVLLGWRTKEGMFFHAPRP